MCGRYALAHPPRDVRQRLIQDGLPVDEEPLEEDIQPGYNIAPGHIEPVYRAVAADGENRDCEGRGNGLKYVLEPMKWGLIPSWTKRPPPPSSLKTINCRSESLLESTGLWAPIKQSKRCIIPAQGFYEWLKKGTDKIPYHIKRSDSHLLLFAGLYDVVHYEGQSSPIYTYTIITVPACPSLQFLHERMPAVLSTPEEVRKWLAPSTKWNKELQEMLKPWDGGLETYTVDRGVGNVKNDEARFILPLDSKENKRNIKNWFVSRKKDEGTIEEDVLSRGGEEKEAVPTETTRTLKREREEEETVPNLSSKAPKIEDISTISPPSKSLKIEGKSPTPSSTPRIRSATSNITNRKPSPGKKKGLKDGTPRITSFFSK